MQLKFMLEERDKKSKSYKYALIVYFEETKERWTIMEWSKKPSDTTIASTKWLFERSCRIYHDQLMCILRKSAPTFKLSE